jgi:hypothetical protein
MRIENEPDFVESIELVAETVTIYAAGAAGGAWYSPPVLIAP